MSRRILGSLLLGVSLWTPSADAQEPHRSPVELTHTEALTLARRQSPALAAARARAREADSQVTAASVLRFNPELSGAFGPRTRPDGRSFDWSASAQQWFELGGQRGRRVDAARAGAEAGAATGEDSLRLVLLEVSRAFTATLYWERRIALADENLRIAESVASVANKRHRVGDVGGLETSAAALAVERARLELDRCRAFQLQAEGRLKEWLGLGVSDDLFLRGELRALGTSQTAPGEPFERPDLRVLRAAIAQAEAEAALGRAERVPNVALGAAYEREESADVVQGTLTIELPLFDHGQATTVVAEARRDRLRAELAAAERSASMEIRTARETAERLSAAVQRFEQGGLETIARTERLATASYEAGAIPLGELLVVRRELMEAKLDHANLLREAADARAELAASMGALR